MKKLLIILFCVLLLGSGCNSAPSVSSSPPVQQSIAAASASAETASAAPKATPAATPTTLPTPSPTPTATPTPTPTPAPTPTPLPPSDTTGLPSGSAYRPIGVMIENRPEARPQSGLGQADIVYEAFMEGCSMTRFFCVFNDHLPVNVGPVRSARIYFIDIAEEYNGMLAFFGGPQLDSKANIYNRLYKTTLQVAANGIGSKYNKLYWRIKERPAPHNVYTNLEKLAAILKPMTPVRHFAFSADAPAAGEDISKINIVYNRRTVNTTYEYDPANRNYKRSIGGEPMMDALTNTQITVTNVILQYAKLTYVDRPGHVNYKLTGKGKADVFIAGKHIKGTRERKNLKAITHYYDETGKEITLLPGNTWVQLMTGSVPVTFSK
jgi:hypothetical protein